MPPPMPRARRPLRSLLLALLLAASATTPAAAQAQEETQAGIQARIQAEAPDEAALFAMPAVAEALRGVAALAAAGEIATARALTDDLAARHPGIGILHANRAGLAMLAGEPDAALEALEAAGEAGLPELPDLLGAPVFAPLAADPARAPRLAALAEAARPPGIPPEAVPLEDGRAPVEAANTRWNPASERLEAIFADPETGTTLPPVMPESAAGAAWDLLRDHWKAGRAAGLAGVLYDNRDRRHSRLDADLFPQLAHTAYADAARSAGIDYGLNDRILFPGRVVLGNSSTAITAGPHWRSLPRHALTRPDGTGPMRLWQNWAANHIYVHPAHQDWGRERGDLFPANTPYLVVSRGSSGSDRPFLEAIAATLAAFPPETRARLEAESLVGPAIQMVLRRSLAPIRSREAYLSGAAHPPVFDRRDLNAARMVSLAQSIAPDALPAEARIAVIEEDLGQEGIDFFGQGLTERLFDTPSAIARIWRSRTGRRSMILSAEASRDASGRPLRFEWRLLQGDPARVTIEPLGENRARVTLDWHDPFTTLGRDRQATARVDIGVFAHNGVHDSAPAILSWHFPPHEARTYETGPDGAPRIAAIDHAARAEAYADPLLLPRASWRDTYAWDADGALLGWTREAGARRDEYTASGRRILGRDAGGAPAATEGVAYPLAHDGEGRLVVEEVSAGS